MRHLLGFLLIPWTYALLIAQASGLAAGGVPVPVLLPATLVTSVAIGGVRGLAFASMCGLLSDAIGAGPVGRGIVLFALAAAVVQKGAGPSAIRTGGLVVLLTGLHAGCDHLSSQLLSQGPLDLAPLPRLAGFSALAAMPMAMVLSLVVQRCGILMAPRIDEGIDMNNRWRMLTNE